MKKTSYFAYFLLFLVAGTIAMAIIKNTRLWIFFAGLTIGFALATYLLARIGKKQYTTAADRLHKIITDHHQNL